MSRKRERLTDGEPTKVPRKREPGVTSAPVKVGPNKSLTIPGPGRQVGSKNKIPHRITEALMIGLEKHGMDGRGKSGLPGYFYFLAATDPKATAHLLGRLLPNKIQASVDPQSALGQVLEAVRARLTFERTKVIEGKVNGKLN